MFKNFFYKIFYNKKPLYHVGDIVKCVIPILRSGVIIGPSTNAIGKILSYEITRYEIIYNILWYKKLEFSVYSNNIWPMVETRILKYKEYFRKVDNIRKRFEIGYRNV